MTKKHQLLIVSNRLPVSVKKQDGTLVYERSSGGLATAMESLGKDHADMLWIGWPGIAADDLTAAEKKEMTEKLLEMGCVPVLLTAEHIELFYNGYANDTLWPLFHYFQQYANYDTEFWDAYKEVNMLYSTIVRKNAHAKSIIWVHDYHLMLLPELLRQKLPDASIGFFLHIPFPSFELFRMLPNRSEILKGMMGADLVGFHVYDYARHFLSSVQRVLGIENNHGSIILGERVIRTDAFPIGIDYNKFALQLKNEETKSEIRKINELHKGQKIILSVDRLDYSKGILERLSAFEQLLIQEPKYREKVTMMVVAVPSRTEVDTYKDLRDELEKAIARINGQYGTVNWIPVTYQFKNLPFHQIVAHYARADVALVTPLRDGMNLVAKEYVACKQDTSGVLILSEMAGAVDELPEALRINPNDMNSLLGAIKRSLLMTTVEQSARLQSMQRRLSRYTVKRWAQDFINQLVRVKEQQHQERLKLLTPDLKKRLIKAAGQAKHRLLLLDYDGTLKPFVSGPNPNLAAPSHQLLKLLKRLSRHQSTQVCIISGRPRNVLEDWLGDLRITLAAEHGAWIKYKSEWSQQQVSLQEYKKVILPILENYAERTPGARIEEKDFAIVWHYRNVAPELAYARNASIQFELQQLLANTDIGVYGGIKIIEVKPRAIHKGTVTEDLVAMHNADFILCAGDDYTDEDMFAALPERAYSIKVGLSETKAKYQVANIDHMLELLELLALKM